MARDTQRRHFSVYHSDAIDENERILEAGRQQRQENREKREKGKRQRVLPLLRPQKFRQQKTRLLLQQRLRPRHRQLQLL